MSLNYFDKILKTRLKYHEVKNLSLEKQFIYLNICKKIKSMKRLEIEELFQTCLLKNFLLEATLSALYKEEFESSEVCEDAVDEPHN